MEDEDEIPLYERRGVKDKLFKEDHDWVVKMLVQSGRYDIEGVEVITNLRDERNRSAGKVEGEDQYPDIVGVDVSEDKPVIIAEIEKEKSVKEKYLEKWKRYASLDIDFYLYVPLEKVADAKRLLDGIKLKGLRAYRATDDGRFYISDVALE